MADRVCVDFLAHLHDSPAAIQNWVLSHDTRASVWPLLSMFVDWRALVKLANPLSRVKDRMIPRLTHSWTGATLACPRRIQ